MVYLHMYVLFGLLLANLVKTNTYRFAILLLLFAGSLWLVRCFHFQSPFFNPLIGRIWSFVVFFNSWGILCLLISAVVYREKSDILPYWILGGMFFAVYSIIYNSRKNAALEIHVDNIDDVNTLILHMQSLVEMVFVRNRKDKDRLSGYIQYHKKYCLDLTCPIRSENVFRRNNQAISSYEQYTTRKYGNLTNFITHLFNTGLKRYMNNVDLRILYCYYLLDMTKNTQQALEQLSICLGSHGIHLDQLYTIERLRTHIVIDAKHSHDTGSRSLAMSSHQEANNRARQLISSISGHMLEFWSAVINDTPGSLRMTADIDRILQICDKVKRADDMLDGMLATDEGYSLEVLRLYASYQDIVMKDAIKADSVYDIIKNRKPSVIGINDYDLSIKKSDDLSKMQLPVIIISGMRDDFCQIVNINNAASMIFGYSKSELMSKKVEILMSDIYARVHDTFVSNYVSTMKGMMINKDRFVMAKHKTRFIIPVTIYIKVYIRVR